MSPKNIVLYFVMPFFKPPNFAMITASSKYQIKFKTTNGFKGAINLHTNEDKVRSVHEGQSVNVNYVNRNRNDSDIKGT